MAKRKFEIEDRREETHVTGGRRAIKVPSGLEMFEPQKSGAFRLEIIPFEVGDAHAKYHPDVRYSSKGKWYYERTYYVHGGIGPDNATFVCANKTFGTACPICDERARLAKHPEEAKREIAYGLRPRERQLFLVLMRNDRGELEFHKPRLWEVSYHNFGKSLEEYIAAADYEDRDSYKKFYHPLSGLTIKVNATEEPVGKGGGKYTDFGVKEFKSRKEEIPEEVFDHGFDLDTMVVAVPYDRLKEIFLGRADADEDKKPAESEDGDSGVSRKPSKPPREEEQQPAPPPKPKEQVQLELELNCKVEFERRGKKTVGTVTKINRKDDVVEVEYEGGTRPAVCDFSEVKVIEAAGDSPTEPEPEPAPKPKPPKDKSADAPKARPKPKGWDDEDD